jgi:hypothetical protein
MRISDNFIIYRKSEERFMEEEKRKQIEAKLHQLFSQSDEVKDEKSSSKVNLSGASVVRRRKGNPDLQIA